jgi:hypothetical protein
MDDEQDRESGLQDDIKAGQRTSLSGCAVALSGIAIPMVMFSIPSIFPCHGECQIGWAGIGFAMVLTPLLVIIGIAVSIAGFRQASKAARELGEDSNQSPDRNL